ncbi:SH3 domain-containing protein [Paraflavitalea speifideaquila]|uniref:SH3 domain-containing protein n=1 Tax=Paraflavitalea speifideaquila TaxID=3076558 RepID=UPI0028EA1E64|nr:SH3 domain-containing protein [Paraflavitalea speifideiaquila]
MKPLYTLLFLLVVAKLTMAQVSVIHDKDGICNVREDAGTSSKVVDKLPNGHLVYGLATKGNWVNIDYANNKKNARDMCMPTGYCQLVPILQCHPPQKATASLSKRIPSR